MNKCLFVTDIHGHVDRYEKLFELIESSAPDAVFIGGDLLPHYAWRENVPDDFIRDLLGLGLSGLKDRMAGSYPDVFVIMGNDDSRVEEEAVEDVASRGLWHYVHNRKVETGGYRVFGYAYVPPTPFLRKDWEKYDVSRYVPPGSVSPEEGRRSVPVEPRESRFETIHQDLKDLTGDAPLDNAIFLFHSPPHDTRLDRAALDGRMVDHVPLDLHVGSIAVRRFIEDRQPLVTLHGHIHESTRLTGEWHDRIGRTSMFNAAHDGPELAVVEFRLDDLKNATRRLV
jgi:Icc-related predicted phosphoesterase